MKTKNIATTSTRQRPDAKLLVIHAEEANGKGLTKQLPINYLARSSFVDQFSQGDVVVVNAAATLPASFTGTHEASGAEIEIRLAQNLHPKSDRFIHWKAIVLGSGDWRLPTEARTEIPHLHIGDKLRFSEELTAEIVAISKQHARLIEVNFATEGSNLLHALYSAGRLIQYSYHQDELELWDGQTIFAVAPLALEAPSAAFPLTWRTILALQAKGVEIAYLHHAAGISSTGDAELDKLLPFPEHYHIPQKTADVINAAKQNGQRVIALGTSVTRALESAVSDDDKVTAGGGIATVLLAPDYQRKIVTGLLTGMHEDGTSHLQLLQSFAPWHLIEKAYTHAKRLGYLWHEYGDSCLIFA